jgi:AraC-like DNA-binding protein
VAYSERPAALPGTVVWRRPGPGTAEPTLVLPDGCVDLIWDGARLFVAGPDTRARWHEGRATASYAALRFSGGVGPAVLGVPAEEYTDLTPGLDELWPAGEARRLTERVAADPAGTLTALAAGWAGAVEIDPFGPRVLAMAGAGWSVGAMADRLGTSSRHLHRRSLSTFGYGPRRLARILRLGRAIEEARGGAPWADVAAGCGYADQAHLSREMRDLTGATPVRLLTQLGSPGPAPFT